MDLLLSPAGRGPVRGQCDSRPTSEPPGPGEEVEIGARVGLEDMVDAEAFPAAPWIGVGADLASLGFLRASFAGGYVDVEPAGFDVQDDAVPGPHEGQRPARRRFRCHVQDDRAVRRAAHAAVADAESKATARPRWRSRRGEAAAGFTIAPSGARLPRRTAMPPSATRGSPRLRMTSVSQIGASSSVSTRGLPVTVRASGSSRSRTSRRTASRFPAR